MYWIVLNGPNVLERGIHSNFYVNLVEFRVETADEPEFGREAPLVTSTRHVASNKRRNKALIIQCTLAGIVGTHS